ncbi:TPA: MerR family transcriptional regulator, partial [Yersinia enterocolitica]
MNYTIKKFQEITRISSHNLRYFDKIGLLVPK